MRRALIGAVAVVVLLVVTQQAGAVGPTPVTCAGLATAMNGATTGEVLQLPTGTCLTNVTVTNTNAFTLEGATGGGTILEPTSPSTPIIQSTADVKFTLSELQLTGDTSQALYLSGTDEAVTISHDVFTNNTGSGAIYVSESGSASQPTVIENSTFSHNHGGEGGAIAWFSGDPLTLTGNTFTANSSSDGADGGGAIMLWDYNVSSTTNPVDVTNNVFGGPTASAGNTSRSTGGGAFVSLQPGQTLTLTGNTFEHNAISGAASSPTWRLGGGLFLDVPYAAAPFPVTQSHNVFKDNVISEPVSGVNTIPTGGAGEWITGLTVTSTSDSFIGNRIAVNDGHYPPEGGGVGAIAAAANSPEPALAATFHVRDDLFIGNSTASGGWGGGIYVGIPDPVCTSSCPASSLTLADSTVVGNSVDAGTGSEGGAIWGNPSDLLSVSNSIIYGNTPKPEIFGFGSSSPTFAFSDVCNEAGGPTVSGSGLICKNPVLTGAGVETTASPTVDAGSNALVPGGLATDLAGNPRIAASRLTCAGTTGPAIVDMGAFEATFKQNPSCNPKVTIVSTKLTDTNGHAKVTLGCPGGYLYCKGTVTLTTIHNGKRLTLGSAQFKVTHGQTSTIAVQLLQSALNQLGNADSVPVVIAVSDQDAQKHHATSSRSVTLTLP